ncbi:MAG: OsmC family protein [Pseudomonadota bacterium]
MKGTVRWVDGVMFLAESESGHTVVIDGPPADGGRNIGIRPMELVLLGVGGCTSFDVMSILKKARQEVTDCVTEITAERADEVPSVFTKIHIHFVITGRALKESQVKRAVELSADKYCSASIMLGRGGVEISHAYEIREG